MEDSFGGRPASTRSTWSCGWRSATSARRARARQLTQPLAIRFLTAQPGPLPTGASRDRPLDKVLAFPGVVQADVYLQVGETILRCASTATGAAT